MTNKQKEQKWANKEDVLLATDAWQAQIKKIAARREEMCIERDNITEKKRVKINQYLDGNDPLFQSADLESLADENRKLDALVIGIEYADTKIKEIKAQLDGAREYSKYLDLVPLGMDINRAMLNHIVRLDAFVNDLKTTKELFTKMDELTESMGLDTFEIKTHFSKMFNMFTDLEDDLTNLMDSFNGEACQTVLEKARHLAGW